MANRKYLPSFAELCDRLSIFQLKYCFLKEHQNKLYPEMQDIIYDLDQWIKEKNIKLSGEMIQHIIILAQFNAHIWYNEKTARQMGKEGADNLLLTHSINGVRTIARNKLLDLIKSNKGRDWKVDCLSTEFKNWDPYGGKK